MGTLDNLAMGLLLIGLLGNGGAHYVAQFDDSRRLLGLPFLGSAMAAFGLACIPFSAAFAPVDRPSGLAFLLWALAVLGMAIWCWRVPLRRLFGRND